MSAKRKNITFWRSFCFLYAKAIDFAKLDMNSQENLHKICCGRVDTSEHIII
jgi:hypothetical protein